MVLLCSAIAAAGFLASPLAAPGAPAIAAVRPNIAAVRMEESDYEKYLRSRTDLAETEAAYKSVR